MGLSRFGILALVVLTILGFPAFAQVQLSYRSVEWPVSYPALFPAALGQVSPSVASNGQNFLVVWEDYRRGSLGDIWGARVNASGEVLDPAGFLISNHFDNEVWPAVTWAGTHWIVAWQQAGRSAIVATRVDTDGEVMDSEPTIVGGYLHGSLTLTFNGSVVLLTNRSSLVITMTADLEVISRVSSFYSNSAASNGTDFLVASLRADGCSNCTSGTVRVSRFDSRGKYESSINVLPTEHLSGPPAIASDGHDYAVAWLDGSRIRLAQLNPDGTVKRIGSEFVGGQLGWISHLSWVGSNYVLAWEENSRIRAVPVSRQGDILGAPVTVGTGANPISALAAGAIGSTFLASWVSGIGYSNWVDTDISGALSDAHLSAVSPLALARSPRRQSAPSITPTSSGLAVTWRENITDQHSAVFLSFQDRAEDFAPLRISDLIEYGGERTSVASAGNSILASWDEGWAWVRFRRFELNGEPVDLEAQLNVEGTDPAVAVIQGNYLLSWLDGSVKSIRVASEGPPLAGSLPTTLTPETQSYYSDLSVSAGDQMALAVWTEGKLPVCQILCPGYSGRTGIYGTRISADGLALDPASLLIFPSSEGAAAVASNGNEFMVIASQPNGLFARRVSADGTLGTESRMNEAAFGPPSVAWDGTAFIVVATELESNDTYRMKVYRLNRDGGVESLILSLAIPTTPNNTEVLRRHHPDPTIVIAAGKPTLIYTRIAYEPEYGGVARSFVRQFLRIRRDRSVRR